MSREKKQNSNFIDLISSNVTIVAMLTYCC